MKIVKFVLVVLVVVVLAFVGLGFAVPEIEYSVTVEIDQPVEVVWNAFHDHDGAKSWIQGLESIELVSGSPLAEGSTYRMTFVEKGKSLVVDETIETVVPHERFVFSTTADGMGMFADTTFEGSEAGTTIVSNVKMKGDGVLTRGLLPLIKGTVAARQQGDLDALKALVEGNA